MVDMIDLRHVMKSDLLQTISTMLNELNTSEAKVARHVLAKPDEIIHQSISTVAGGAKVSEPTVMRFCRSLGCKGFQDMKLGLAASLAGNTPYVHTSLSKADSTTVVAEKVCQSSANALRVLYSSLNIASVDKAIDAMMKAEKIDIYGSGASGIVALDAQHKLFRTNVPTVAYRDSHLQMMSAASLDANCLALAISYTGRSSNIIKAAEMARQREAVVIGITDENSPLAECCDTIINNPNTEDTTLVAPMASRICQLAIIDILTARIALKKGAEVWEHLKKIKEGVSDLRPHKKAH